MFLIISTIGAISQSTFGKFICPWPSIMEIARYIKQISKKNFKYIFLNYRHTPNVSSLNLRRETRSRSKLPAKRNRGTFTDRLTQFSNGAFQVFTRSRDILGTFLYVEYRIEGSIEDSRRGDDSG